MPEVTTECDCGELAALENDQARRIFADGERVRVLAGMHAGALGNVLQRCNTDSPPERKASMRALPHPAIIVSGPQLLRVITELEAGTYPQPDDAIWRDDLPRDLAERLARATGATEAQIAEITRDPELAEVPAHA